MEGVFQPMRSMRKGNSMWLTVVFCLVGISVWRPVFGQVESTKDFVNQMTKAYGSKYLDGSVTTWEGRGKIAITGYNKSQPLDFVLFAKGNGKLQRIVYLGGKEILRQGSDGKNSWQSSGPFSGKAAGMSRHLIESYTTRAVASLFGSSSIKDLGLSTGLDKSDKSCRLLEVAADKGKSTRYYVDTRTYLVRQLDLDTGSFYVLPMGSTKYPLMISYIFSDYRDTDGAMRPYKIEVYRGLTKTEEVTFDAITTNVPIEDSVFGLSAIKP
jgi:hypothetical protein